ncbi:hypothetical protein BJX63DRAFT_397743 [Aspergillus granulosus]|uniref:CBM-cenC domain-containing protein n=1 Tax=Aspergillus granulosus TaxID=176169 RepID=A0ABR4H928_9EURO
MSCVLTQNPGFEAGMTGWYPSENTIAYPATNTEVAYAGNNFLDIAVTSVANEGIVSQNLVGLDTATPHNLTLYVRVDQPIPSVLTCMVSTYMESNPEEIIASDLISHSGEWLRLTRVFTPTQADDVLSIAGSCAFLDDYTFNHIFIDEVVLSDCDTE